MDHELEKEHKKYKGSDFSFVKAMNIDSAENGIVSGIENNAVRKTKKKKKKKKTKKMKNRNNENSGERELRMSF